MKFIVLNECNGMLSDSKNVVIKVRIIIVDNKCLVSVKNANGY